MVEAKRRLGIERTDLGHHVGQIFGIDAADLEQRRYVTRRQEFQIVEQGLDRRVQTVALPQLERQTLAQVSGEDTGRIEALDPQQNLFDMLHSQFNCSARSERLPVT